MYQPELQQGPGAIRGLWKEVGCRGGGGEAAQPQADSAAHPGAVVSWSPAPAARQRLI